VNERRGPSTQSRNGMGQLKSPTWAKSLIWRGNILILAHSLLTTVPKVSLCSPRGLLWGSSAWRRKGSGETVFQYLKGACKKAREGFLKRACSDRTRGNGFKVEEGRFRLDIRKKFLTMRVVRQWNRLPREAVAAPSLEVFKARLDGALNNQT